MAALVKRSSSKISVTYLEFCSFLASLETITLLVCVAAQPVGQMSRSEFASFLLLNWSTRQAGNTEVKQDFGSI